MIKAIYFDMDGTIANLYQVENWLPKLRAHDESPYLEAIPMLRLCSLARILNKLQKMGYKIGIVSWLSKDPNKEYGEKVTAAKLHWLAKHLPSVHFDEIKIVPYGMAKSQVISYKNGILFDDEENNRNEWETNGGVAYDVNEIIEILKKIK